jgi:hypothetical protein
MRALRKNTLPRALIDVRFALPLSMGETAFQRSRQRLEDLRRSDGGQCWAKSRINGT